MRVEGWMLVLGLRIFDVGLLVLWVVWVFRLREESEPPDERLDGGGDDGGPLLDPPDPHGAGGLELFAPGLASPGPRLREHGGRAPIRTRTREPERPAPARVD